MTNDKIMSQLNEMDDETLKQFCYETFNHRFFEEFFDTMCYGYSDIWRIVTSRCLKDADITKQELEQFNN